MASHDKGEYEDVEEEEEQDDEADEDDVVVFIAVIMIILIIIITRFNKIVIPNNKFQMASGQRKPLAYRESNNFLIYV